jgi:hypothetical protein
MSMTKEPNVVINGQELTEAQAMTIRNAIESFDSTLRVDGLGDDEHGSSMVKSYRKNIDDIREIIFKE